VDPTAFNIPDYFDVIKSPKDFSMIKSKLANNVYSNFNEFKGEMELVFSNCITYNGENSDYGVIAKNIRDEFNKLCTSLKMDFYDGK